MSGENMASQLQKQIYQAYITAGLSPNQARIITAEVGRENSFNPQTVFGVHSDPKNRALNLGMLSWQGDRGKSLYKYMHSKGLIQNGSMVRNQAALDEMARFSINEMKNNPSYSATAKKFLNNPNVDYKTGAAVLGRNYIRWRYDDPQYSSGHANRDQFYRAMGGNMQPQQALQEQDNYEYVPQNMLGTANNPQQHVQNQPQDQYEYVPSEMLGGSKGSTATQDNYEYVPENMLAQMNRGG